MTNEEKAIELLTSEVGDLNVPDFDREFEIKTASVRTLSTYSPKTYL